MDEICYIICMESSLCLLCMLKFCLQLCIIFQDINECTKNLHDCSPNANCIDTPESFTCKCGDDFVDESPDPMSRSGRICRPALVDECRVGKHDCHPDVRTFLYDQ